MAAVADDGSLQCTVRPLAGSTSALLTEDSLRIHLSAKALKRLGLKAGETCKLITDRHQAFAVAWPATQSLNEGIVQLGKLAQEALDAKLGDRVRVERSVEAWPRILEVIYEVENSPGGQVRRDGPKEKAGIEWCVQHSLERCKYIFAPASMSLQHPNGSKITVRLLSIQRIDTATSTRRGAAVFTCESRITEAAIGEEKRKEQRDSSSSPRPSRSLGPAPGLEKCLHVLQRQLDLLYESSRTSVDGHKWRPGSILLYGPSGIGKSYLLGILEKQLWLPVFKLGAQASSQISVSGRDSVEDVMTRARAQQASVVLIDDLSDFAPPNPSERGRDDHVRVLLTEMNKLWTDDCAVMVVAAARNPDQVHPLLRRPRMFETEVLIPTPDKQARLSMLRALIGRDPSPELQRDLGDIAARTHGYVAADLDLLVRKAYQAKVLASGLATGMGKIVKLESTAIDSENRGEHVKSPLNTSDLIPSFENLQSALHGTKPSVMRDVSLKPAEVRWADIGGQQELKSRLRQAIEWPIKHEASMRSYGISPRRGVLLYGPPGCSKTLSARAVATEADLNFLAVKGAELVNMFLGESERAVRNLFQKARAASPSIIFFDEIDSIGTRRDQQHGSLNVLTTLLNEMDGIEMLGDVVIMAATNRPEILDAALLRPGRFDTLIYVGPPDLRARQEILGLKIGKMLHSEDLDLHALAVSTDGYSGAEIVNLCDVAGHLAMQVYIASGEMLPVSQAQFNEALKDVKPQISSEMSQRLESWKPADNYIKFP